MTLSAGSCIAAPVDSDPLLYRVELPFKAKLYPMGYAVELSTNSAAVLDVAAKLWRRYPALSDAPPVQIRVIADDRVTASFREPSLPRGQGNLVSIVHGPQDYAVADLTSGFAFVCLSQLSVSQPSYFRYHFLEPLTYVLQASRHFALVHASCVSRNGRALVLCGASGSGKTCLAYMCAKRGWNFISGDAVQVVRGRDDHMVIGRPYEIRFRETAQKLFPELGSIVPELRPNGKVDLEVDTNELSIPLALNGPAHNVVFLERASMTAIERYDRNDVLERLQETICFGDERSRCEQRASLEQFSRLPLWRLRYSDPGGAEVLLRSLQ